MIVEWPPKDLPAREREDLHRKVVDIIRESHHFEDKFRFARWADDGGRA